MGETRAVSDLVGMVLLVGVVVILATSIGYAIISNTNDRRAQQGPLVDINVTAIDTDADPAIEEIKLTHTNGESLEADKLVVRVTDQDTDDTGTYTIDPVDIDSGDSDDRFEPGETHTQALSSVGGGLSPETADVSVIHDESTVLERATVEGG